MLRLRVARSGKTGDRGARHHRRPSATARAVAHEIGLNVSDECVITGARWERMSIAERAEVVKDHVIYARMSPKPGS